MHPQQPYYPQYPQYPPIVVQTAPQRWVTYPLRSWWWKAWIALGVGILLWPFGIGLDIYFLTEALRYQGEKRREFCTNEIRVQGLGCLWANIAVLAIVIVLGACVFFSFLIRANGGGATPPG